MTKYKTNPARPSFEETIALAQKYSTIPAAELQDWNIGPYCEETSCRVPFGVAVGNNNTPVNVFVSFHGGLITEIDVSFSETYWNEMLPFLDQKYGADWNIKRDDMPVTNFRDQKNHFAGANFAEPHHQWHERKHKSPLPNLGNKSGHRVRTPRCVWAISFRVCD